MDQPTKLDGAQEIMKIVKDTFGDKFRKYALGIPEELPEAAFPCVIVQKINGTFQVSATNTDQWTEQVMVHIMANKKEGFGAPDDDDTVMRKLFKMIEGVDPATGYFNENTFMYALRSNLTLHDSVINHDIEIQYDVNDIDPDREIYEAIILVNMIRQVIIQNRS